MKYLGLLVEVLRVESADKEHEFIAVSIRKHIFTKPFNTE